jgi:hypothetical protein
MALFHWNASCHVQKKLKQNQNAIFLLSPWKCLQEKERSENEGAGLQKHWPCKALAPLQSIGPATSSTYACTFTEIDAGLAYFLVLRYLQQGLSVQGNTPCNLSSAAQRRMYQNCQQRNP